VSEDAAITAAVFMAASIIWKRKPAGHCQAGHL